MLRSSLVVVALLLVACSPTTDSSDAGGPTANPASWGLVDNTCRHYQDDSGNQDFALEIHKSTKFPGVVTWDVIERFNGLTQGLQERWFEVTADSLLVRGMSDYSALGPTSYYQYDPPPVFLKNDLDEGGGVDSDTTAKISGDRNGSFPQHFSVAVAGTETLALGTKSVDATELIVSITEDGQPDQVERYWLASGTGIAKLQPAGSSVAQTFVSSETIGSDGCL